MDKLDILAFGAHPDDVELGCAGTLITHISKGRKAGVVDLTQGELGTRGNAKLRLEEAQAASSIMGLAVRENLGFRDGFFVNDEPHQLKVISVIRKYRPEIILMPAPHDRHPDHGRSAKLISDACFLSGLEKIDTKQEAWRPKAAYHYIQFMEIKPDFIVDISEAYAKKMEAIGAYGSQFYNPDSDEPQTLISTKAFMDLVTSRSVNLGAYIGASHGEGFITQRYPGVKNLFDLI
ncbi:MAG: bacillithiol biosynthesis deacetylase BshB1 [Flavobacteriales bacterium]|nr:bacillithiol biosynthesis deacetylase BshB1 [Flavobacteriales bacterium]